MKRFLYLILCLLCTVPYAYAQPLAKAGKSMIQAAVSSTPKKATEILNKIPAAVSSAEIYNSSFSSASSAAVLPVSPKILIDKTVLHQAMLNRILNRTMIPTDMRIFQAVKTDSPNVRFSGTVFRTSYNGKEEIYGVIATHIIPSFPKDIAFGIHRHFTAVFYNNESVITIPAEVVAASPTSMLDIALVKFPTEYEKLLKPYDLGTLNPQQPLYSVGFNRTGIAHITDRQILKITPSSIRTEMPVQRLYRPGLCGSAVLNEHNQLVGIHTGSGPQLDSQRDQAFVTPANYLHILVEAYHNPEETLVPFYFTPNQSLNLRLDEHITFVSLLDDEGNTLWEYEVLSRFSHSQLENALHKYWNARFLDITTHKIQWTDDGLVLRTKLPIRISPSKAYIYDLEKKQLKTSYEIK